MGFAEHFGLSRKKDNSPWHGNFETLGLDSLLIYPECLLGLVCSIS